MSARETLNRGIRALLALIHAAAVILLICSVGLNFANIIGRYLLGSAITWAEESMLFLMVGCVFLGSAPVAWSGRHIRMDVFVRLLPRKVRDALALFSEIVFVTTAITLAVFAWPTIRQLYAFDQRSLAANIPLVVPQGMIPLGLVLMALLVLCRMLSGQWRDSTDPHDAERHDA